MMEVAQSSQKKITILHVVSNISVRSGIMSCIMNYYRNMNGVRFVFLYFDIREITYEEEIKSLGGEVIKLSTPKNVVKFFSELHALKEHYINVFDIIELHDPFMVTFFARLKKQLKIKKMIVHAHSTRFSDSKLGEVRNRLLSIGNTFLPDAYFACSSLAGEKIFGKKFCKSGIVIHNAINLDRFMKKEYRASLREKYSISEKFVIVHIGNFAEPKNHPFIIFQEELHKAESNHSKNENYIKAAKALGNFDFEKDVIDKLYKCVGNEVNFRRHTMKLIKLGLLAFDDYSIAFLK